MVVVMVVAVAGGSGQRAGVQRMYTLSCEKG